MILRPKIHLKSQQSVAASGLPYIWEGIPHEDSMGREAGGTELQDVQRS